MTAELKAEFEKVTGKELADLRKSAPEWANDTGDYMHWLEIQLILARRKEETCDR